MNIGCSWSGGKDSCYALMMAKRSGHHVKALVNMMNENGEISRSHGLPHSILQLQADAMHVPLVTQPTSWNDYETHFVQSLKTIKEIYSVETMVFGDIDLQQHRDWEEMVCSKAGMQAMLPIWKNDRSELITKMLDEGMKAIIVSCNTNMGEHFLGRTLSNELVKELQAIDVDVCGENGEFHTVVVNCELFQNPIQLPSHTTILHNNYWFLQWRS
jgi:diphthine-ammonia ligase